MPSSRGRRIKSPTHLAAMAIDPGGTTGIAFGVVPLKADSTAAAFKAGDWISEEVYGTASEQALYIWNAWAEWLDVLDSRKVGLPIMVRESFQLRPNKAHGAGSDPQMLAPVRVLAGIDALMGEYGVATAGERETLWKSRYDAMMIAGASPDDASGGVTAWRTRDQTPSERTVVSNDRLKRWGLWVKGSDHERDAVRHLALLCMKEAL